MGQKIFSFNERTKGYSIMISPCLMSNLLACFDHFFFSKHTSFFNCIFDPVTSEFKDKLHSSVLRNKLEDKKVKGVKITFYYEEE